MPMLILRQEDNDQLTTAVHSPAPAQSDGSSLAQKAIDGNEAFVARARRGPTGWEIPAVMEQALNSDLPGELKALVTSNVYDTATDRYVLIPQGSRLPPKSPKVKTALF